MKGGNNAKTHHEWFFNLLAKRLTKTTTEVGSHHANDAPSNNQGNPSRLMQTSIPQRKIWEDDSVTGYLLHAFLRNLCGLYFNL